jgi:triosephosphate isomerase
MRIFLYAANWKMNKTPDEGRTFVDKFLSLISPSLHRQVIIFPSTLGLTSLLEAVKKTQSIAVGAQNCYFEKQGAFTGETSPSALAMAGAKFCLVGHSERRVLFGETNSLVAKKVKACQSEGLVPMLCVGETLKDRESGQTAAVIQSQLRESLSLADLGGEFTIAYEPVWAIGTGQVATPDQAEEAHRILRATLTEIGGSECGSRIQILYGGSVSAQNARELKALPNVDGFLIGGASLQPDSFASIVNMA